MQEKLKLPSLNEYGYYEMRLESIGGLGANLCAKLLGELGAKYLGVNSASFSSYGSEKRGSPVKGFVRFCDHDRELRINSPVMRPHILGLFHEAMIGKLPVTNGCNHETKVIINSADTPKNIYLKLKANVAGVYCVDALKIAIESKSRINMVMLGAIVKASGFIPLEMALKLAEDTIGKKYPELLKNNIEGIKRGYNDLSYEDFKEGSFENSEYKENPNVWGYNTAPIGGVSPWIGSTISNDLQASRQGYIPLFIKEKCINCGLCDTTCPDMVFRFEMGDFKGRKQPINMGLDYHHCKGCLRCVNICPTKALVKAEEREHPNPEFFVRNKDLIAQRIEYEEVGANAEVTGEAYLTEKRVDGGMV